jgi:subtilisin family serine protease
MKWIVKSACLVLAVLTTRAGVPENWQDKVDPRLLQGAPATNEFLVILSEQADLSGAAALKTKAAKGRYVFERLTEVAQRTQQPLLKTLQEKKLEYQPFWVANMIWVRGDLSAIQSLAQRADTARIVANSANRVPDLIPTTAAPRIASSVEWNLSQVHAPDVWALGYTGQGVVVAGQDTGYQWNHPALINHYRGWDGTNANHNYNWHDAIHGLNPHNTGDNPCGYDLLAPCDDLSHGTHTMGTMVGDDGTNHIGMAPGAKWIGCRNMERNWGTPATYAECFQWFLAPTDLNGQNPDPSKAPDVINNSWYCPPEEGCGDPLVLQSAVENVRAAGIVVVFAAGNSGSGCSSIDAPGAMYDASFTVGATDSGDNIAWFSSRGPVTVDGSNRPKPDVSAPGVNIRSSVPINSYAGGWSGTSMAAPHVVGVVALLISAHPELKGQVDGIERIIEHTAVPRTDSQSCGGVPGTEIPNNTYGWGRVDALAALGLGDSDGDGMPDWWELWHGLNPNDPSDAALDSDGDGVSNLDEYLAGTDPMDAADYFHIASITAGTNCVLSFQSALNRLYILESRTNLAAGSWTSVPGQVDIGGNTGLLELSQTNLPPDTARFYRVKVQIAP